MHLLPLTRLQMRWEMKNQTDPTTKATKNTKGCFVRGFGKSLPKPRKTNPICVICVICG
jgi:hypothetical protein